LPNTYFQFKQFIIHHDRCAMKVTTDACLFGAWVSNEMQNAKANIQNALDIGCGTGLLSLQLAQKNHVVIDAIEIDKDAAEQATENVLASSWKERINIIHTDALKWKAEKKYDLIISNPPFYEGDLKPVKPNKKMAHHSDGLRLEELLAFIKAHLKEDGVFYLLLPAKRMNDLANLSIKADLHLRKIIKVKQTTRHLPFRLMVQGSSKKGELISREELSIKGDDQQYTPRFVNLLKDYYLYL
jgi:tRNA1Val (adenine37-N6)-methyltransferase